MAQCITPQQTGGAAYVALPFFQRQANCDLPLLVNLILNSLFLLGSAKRLVLRLALLIASSSICVGQSAGFEVAELAEGVYAAVRREPPGLTVNANSVFIINDSDVVVVDTTLTPGTARELLTALRTSTNKPVKYVINTHWHDDHIMGSLNL
jgi:hypothetical protein